MPPVGVLLGNVDSRTFFLFSRMRSCRALCFDCRGPEGRSSYCQLRSFSEYDHQLHHCSFSVFLLSRVSTDSGERKHRRRTSDQGMPFLFAGHTRESCQVRALHFRPEGLTFKKQLTTVSAENGLTEPLNKPSILTGLHNFFRIS